jgi:hypothetical protein
MFLPPNTTSMLQPLDHCVIAAFKLYYFRKNFSRRNIATDIKEGIGKKDIKIFWKGFTIFDGIKTIGHAWNDVKISTMKGTSKKLCP